MKRGSRAVDRFRGASACKSTIVGIEAGRIEAVRAIAIIATVTLAVIASSMLRECSAEEPPISIWFISVITLKFELSGGFRDEGAVPIRDRDRLGVVETLRVMQMTGLVMSALPSGSLVSAVGNGIYRKATSEFRPRYAHDWSTKPSDPPTVPTTSLIPSSKKVDEYVPVSTEFLGLFGGRFTYIVLGYPDYTKSLFQWFDKVPFGIWPHPPLEGLFEPGYGLEQEPGGYLQPWVGLRFRF